MIRTIILFIIVFGLVVISHELGHFLIGRKNGIRVVEFSVGMGPTLFSFTKNGTKYSLKLLPLGGACMFDGEDLLFSVRWPVPTGHSCLVSHLSVGALTSRT